MAAKRSTKRSTSKPAARGKKPAAKAKAKKVKAAASKARPAAKKKVAAKSARPAKRATARKTSAPAAAATPPPPPAAASAAFQSRFVWFDLVTPDVAKSGEFYKTLFSWSSKDLPVGPPANTYTMLSGAGSDFGGLAPKMDSPSPTHWLPYVLVEDVDQTSRRAEALGGKVFMPAMDIPNVGRFAIISDPTGGTVAPMSLLDPKPPPKYGVVGPVAWVELFTDDIAKAGQFYSELFGWSRSEMDMGPGGIYTLFKAGEQNIGGMIARKPDQPVTMWLTYFGVEDVDAKHRLAVMGGAREVVAPADIPSIGRFSILVDPQGAAFALFKPTPMPAA